ncbi:MAG: YfiR family protein [Armatimonadota bacterium]
MSLALAALLAAASGLLCLPRAEAQDPREYSIKAAYLYNFARYVDWPQQALPENGNLVVGVIGKDPFGPALNTLSGKNVKGRNVVVRRFDTPREASRCHVLFIPESERSRLPQILEAVKDESVLTVSDISGFARSGGMINFKSEDNRIRFEINPGAAERAKLSLSSQLLKLAKVVRT